MANGGDSLAVVRRFPVVVASFVVSTGSRAHRLRWFRHRGSVIAAPGL